MAISKSVADAGLGPIRLVRLGELAPGGLQQKSSGSGVTLDRAFLVLRLFLFAMEAREIGGVDGTEVPRGRVLRKLEFGIGALEFSGLATIQTEPENKQGHEV